MADHQIKSMQTPESIVVANKSQSCIDPINTTDHTANVASAVEGLGKLMW